MNIDIRNVSSEKITQITFADKLYVSSETPSTIRIVDLSEDSVLALYKEDIDNLIKALEKAKELWG